VKQAVQSGSYQIDAGRVADKTVEVRTRAGLSLCRMRAAVSRMYWIARSRSRAPWRRLCRGTDRPDRRVAEAVEQKAAEKIQILENIEKLEVERRALCDAPNAPGLAATVAERWRALLELMAGCRTANEVNGHIIHVRQHQIGQLIDIVRGAPNITYGPQGKTFAKAQRALARGLIHVSSQPPR